VELQKYYSDFQKNGAEIVALAVASLQLVDGARQSTQATYPMLADPMHKVAEAYGVYNLLGFNLATPSVFVIERDGRIVWHYIGQNSLDRPAAENVLKQLQDH
jgi:peroxiredoxin